jgi:hypothetical protein
MKRARASVALLVGVLSRRALPIAALVLVPVALAALPILMWFGYTAQAPGGSSAAPVAATALTCSVKASCGVGEVEVFRMSTLSNAHAGTPAGSAYANVVCCGGVTGLSNACADTYTTVLTLSGADNAHVASDGSYATEVCLSVPSGTAACTYGPTCSVDEECLATISGTTNAHIADCDGVDDYATKVCCQVDAASACSAGNDTDGDSWLDEDEWAIGTDCEDDCPDDGTDDALPPDFTMDKTVNILDVLMFKPKLPPNPYDARYDLTVDSTVNILDVLMFKPELVKPWPCT